MKIRKPRTKSGPMQIDGPSHIRGRENFWETIAETKIADRVRKNLCPGCGNKVCKCKSKG